MAKQKTDKNRQARQQMIDESNANTGAAFDYGLNHEQRVGEQIINQPVPAAFDEGELKPQQVVDGQDAMIDMGVMPIGKEEIRRASEILKKYKEGKKNYERTIVANEKWYKKRHWELMESESTKDDPKPSSAWLFSTLAAKHADFMDNAPRANILAREMEDQEEASILESIIPVILEQNDFEQTYSDNTWYLLKHGGEAYGCFWNSSKRNGLGEVEITAMDILNIFWKPGITDIQKSPNLFTVELVENEVLQNKYPELKGKLKDQDDLIQKYYYDEHISTREMTTVVDWYYKKNIDGRETVQYVKFCGDTVLYATENDNQPEIETKAEPVYDEMGNPGLNEDGTYAVNWVEYVKREAPSKVGLYDHGKYPFVFSALYPEPGMPVGFGLIHICKSTQASIDIMNNCLEKNAQHVCNPRYLNRNDGGVNEEELADPNKLIVHSDGNLGADSLAPLQVPQMFSGNYLTYLDQKVNEMKETAGNRDVSNGGTTGGATAASAIAAQIESSGKTSRDLIKASYRTYKEIVYMVIELIRQFYDIPRQFRVQNEEGQNEYVTYSNENLKEQHMGVEYGYDMGYRKPEFDIDVQVEKESAYTRMSQNELAIQLYNNGFFNPQLSDQALATLSMMKFTGKEEVVQNVRQNGTLYDQLMQMQQQMMMMAQILDKQNGTTIAQDFAGDVNRQTLGLSDQPQTAADVQPVETREPAHMAKAKKRTEDATSPT